MDEEIEFPTTGPTNRARTESRGRGASTIYPQKTPHDENGFRGLTFFLLDDPFPIFNRIITNHFVVAINENQSTFG